MNGAFRFRQLGLEYLAEILRIEEASFSHPWGESALRQELTANPLAHYLGCFCQGELIAFAGMWLVVDEGQIANVAVAPAWRRQGVGRLLMEQMIAKCIALGGTRLCLEVRQSNQPARMLYTALGFQEVGLRKGYYTQPTEDAILMDLDLPRLEPR